MMVDAASASILAFALAMRACVGLFGYSGEGTPPMYGDFEAQRHWMEITVNLPASSWYVHGPNNDLLYWGLDYPPLSAHLSFVLGKLAIAFGHPNLVALHTSRGHETPATRAFMRNTVLVCDALIFMSAAAAFASAVGAQSNGGRRLVFSQLLFAPALILVDHGHFQYNAVSLGLTLWASHLAMGGGRPLACCVAFSLALNFKQMSLYLAPAFFCYLLAGCFHCTSDSKASRRRRLVRTLLAILRLGAAVIVTFAACWVPFLGSTDAALAVVRRVFPVERHLYEDKVANIWCTLALLPFLKLKQMLPIATLLRVALGTTLVALLPPCAILLWRPSRAGFLLCALSCGLAFFLCSFQVHEKHILLPLLPASLLAHRQPTLFAWFSALATFSLYPLLKRDGLAPAYAITQLSFLAFSLSLVTSGQALGVGGGTLPMPRGGVALMSASLTGALLLHALESLVTPPVRYPDLHSVLFAAYSCAHFVVAYCAAVALQWGAARAADGRDKHTPMDSKSTTFEVEIYLDPPGTNMKRKVR